MEQEWLEESRFCDMTVQLWRRLFKMPPCSQENLSLRATIRRFGPESRPSRTNHLHVHSTRRHEGRNAMAYTYDASRDDSLEKQKFMSHFKELK